MNKYTYYKVIQGNYGYGWNDEDFHETDSTYWPKNIDLYKANLTAYRLNGGGCYRVINRRELNPASPKNILIYDNKGKTFDRYTAGRYINRLQRSA